MDCMYVRTSSSMYLLETVITVRDKYAQGIGNSEMLHEFNRVYLERMEEYEKCGHCVDHHGVQERSCVIVATIC